MKKFILMLLLSYSAAQAQPALRKGERLPESFVKRYKIDSHNPLLLVFWATWCSPCLKGFPTLDSLQHVFGERVNIIGVAYEPKAKVEELLKRQPELRPKYFRLITGDSLLSYKLFPHRVIPHIVWLDTSGKFITTSAEDYVTADNIRRVLRGEPPLLREKKDVKGFDPHETFHLMDSDFTGRSLLTRYTPGIAGHGYYGRVEGQPGKYNRLFFSNASIRSLYLDAAFKSISVSVYNTERLIWEAGDSVSYMDYKLAPQSYKAAGYQVYADWQADHEYTYDLVLPHPVSDTVLREYMRQDLNRYLGLNGHEEERLVNCSVMIRISAPPVTGGPLTKLDRPKLLALLNHLISTSQVVDETGDNLPVELDMIVFTPGVAVLPEKLDKMLRPYGLKLMTARRRVKVFVVSK